MLGLQVFKRFISLTYLCHASTIAMKIKASTLCMWTSYKTMLYIAQPFPRAVRSCLLLTGFTRCKEAGAGGPVDLRQDHAWH